MQLAAAAGDLHLKVHDLGRIWLPVTVATARRLCKIAQLARHGFKDQTPSPLYHRILRLSPRRPRKTNICPE